MIPDDRHPTADELADLALGVFEDGEAAAVKVHLASCVPCAQVFSQLGGLQELLGAIWYPPVPEGISERIENVLTVEVCQRAAVASGRCPAWCRAGVVDSAASLGPSDHLCWAYRSQADWADRAVEFAADGLVAGRCIQLIGDASTADLRSELAEVVASLPVARKADTGAVAVHEVADVFQWASDGIVDSDATIAFLRAAIDEARAAGYTGLRAAVDVTPLARTKAQRDATARLEYQLDRQMSSQPMGAMCGYDVEDIGPEAVAELACMHPFSNAGATPFMLYAHDDADFGLAGVIDDVTAVGIFRAALERTDPPAGNELIVDCRGAESISERALAELDAHAARMGRTAVLRTTTSNSPSPASLSSLTSLAIETVDSSKPGS